MFSESRYRLAWIVCILLLAGFISNSISSYFVSRNNVRQTITESSLPLTSDNIYSVIQRDLLKPIFISSMMANDAFLREWTVEGETNLAQMQRYLDEIRREYDTVTSFFVSERTQNYYYWGGVLKQVDENEPRDVWYYRVRDLDVPFEINVDYDMANRDVMTIFVNYRVYDFEGNYIGAAGTGLTVNRVNSLIEEYEHRFGREIFFVDRSGKIVLSPENSRLAQYGDLASVPGLENHAASLLDTQSDNLEYRRDGETYFLNSRFVHELNWFLMVEQTEDQLLAPLRETLLMNIGLATLITAVVAAVCITAINRHHRKLEGRNAELSRMNQEIQRQKAELEHGALELETANNLLSTLNREKDDFLGIVAHDLRTPLNGILGLCEAIQHTTPEAPKNQEYLADIRDCGYHMLELIGDILDVASIESFHGPIELESFNWNQIAQQACERFRPQAESKQIDLIPSLSPQCDCEILTRSKWMQICVNNLLSNAIKYSASGKAVRVETRCEADVFQISVIDQGPGIHAEEVGKIFDKFTRLSPQPTAGEPSSGLGLYIVKKMCERLGARIVVESTLGVGSRFTLSHPFGDQRQI